MHGTFVPDVFRDWFQSSKPGMQFSVTGRANKILGLQIHLCMLVVAHLQLLCDDEIIFVDLANRRRRLITYHKNHKCSSVGSLSLSLDKSQQVLFVECSNH